MEVESEISSAAESSIAEEVEDPSDDDDNLDDVSSITATTSYSEETRSHPSQETCSSIGATEEIERSDKDTTKDILKDTNQDIVKYAVQDVAKVQPLPLSTLHRETPQLESSVRPSTSSGNQSEERNSKTSSERRLMRSASGPRDLHNVPSLLVGQGRMEGSVTRKRKEELRRLMQSTDILSRPKAAMNFAKALDRFSRWGITTPTHEAQSKLIRQELKKSPAYLKKAEKLDSSPKAVRLRPLKGKIRLPKPIAKPKLICEQACFPMPTKNLSSKEEKKTFIARLHKLAHGPLERNDESSSDEYDDESDEFS